MANLNDIDMSKVFMDINQIKEYLPHRYPFLLIDRIIDFKPNEYLIGLKNVTVNEEVFNGHFPQKPIYPGVMIVEGMAQAGGLFFCLTNGVKDQNLPISFMSIDQCKFRVPVVPGDTLVYKITPINVKQSIAKLQGEVLVNQKLVAQAVVTAMLGGKANA
ncbi:3-hydroxyacyl-ACP dehydratase FabZ [Rickettsiales bacterium LUAb2]